MIRSLRRVTLLDVSPGALLAAGPAVAAASPIALPVHLYPPEDSQNINLAADAALAGAVGAQVTPLTFLTPVGRRGVVRSFGIFADNPLATTRLTWSLRVQGVPAPGLDAVTFIPRAAGSYAATFDVLVLTQPGDRIDVVITNNDGAPIRAGATLGGWTYGYKQGASGNG